MRDPDPAEEELIDEALELVGDSAILVELEIDELDGVSLAEIGPMDLGTCSATLALNAAGCPTISACAGHVGGYPYIAFWTRPAWVPLLREAATAASVGLGNALDGAAEVFTNAQDLKGMLRLARELEKRLPAFGSLRS